MKVTKITRVAVERLRINEGQLEWLPRNPRTWTQTDIDRMVRSVEEDPDFADVRPVLAVPGTGKELIVFAHNLLTKAAQVRGDKTLPVAVFEPESDEDRATIRRLALKDNGSFGSWDTDALANEWDADPEVLEGWGVPEWITGGAGKTETGSGAEAGSGEPSAKEDENFDPDKGILVRCKPGDIWQLGEHRLMCGDSTDLETVKALMDGGGVADMVFTDPPYGVTQQKWDIAPNLDNMFTCMLSVSREDAALLIFSSQPFTTDLIEARKDLFRYDIIWRKTAPTGFYDAHKRPLRIHEIICVFYRKQPCFFPQKTVVQGQTGIGRKRGNSNYMKTCGGSWGPVGREKAESYEYEEDGTRYPTSVIECSNWNGTLFGDTSRSVVHPTQKPVALADYMLKSYSQEGDIVLDLFGGSGTTLIAAEQLGRKARLMEIDPHYCDIILSRWEQLTGHAAKKVTK